MKVMVSTPARGSEQRFGNEGKTCQLQIALIGSKKEQRWTKLLLELLSCCLAHPAAALGGQNLASANGPKY